MEESSREFSQRLWKPVRIRDDCTSPGQGVDVVVAVDVRRVCFMVAGGPRRIAVT